MLKKPALLPPGFHGAFTGSYSAGLFNTSKHLCVHRRSQTSRDTHVSVAPSRAEQISSRLLTLFLCTGGHR